MPVIIDYCVEMLGLSSRQGFPNGADWSGCDVHLRRIKATPCQPSADGGGDEVTRVRVIIIVTWVLAVVLLGSFALVGYGAIFKSPMPDIINYLCVGSFGYFGGSFVTFMRVRRGEPATSTHN